jgi:FlgD Ig-like domain/FG-GAP-like repeat
MKFFILLLLTAGLLYPQTFTRELNSIPVSDIQGNLTNIFSGGTNNLEHQFVDIDNDGDLDIFYLDSDGTFGWYENKGNPETPDFVLSFDTIQGLLFNDWFYLVDIDNDGDADLFTGTPGALIKFSRNAGNAFTPIFTTEQDSVRDDKGNLISSEFGCNPVFVDIDNDGDYDFISGNSVGTLYYYENIGTATDFSYKFITDEWQGIIIISGDINAGSRHGASSLDFVDIDADGDQDLFWGDFFSKSLYYIENFGTAAAPDMQVVYNRYPHNQDSVYTSGFNMPRFADIDNDGDLDLFVSVLYDPTVPQSLMFFRNEGTSVVNDFHKVTENYLKTLDVGNDSAPFFADIDDDGDADLFLGSTKNPNGTLEFLENVGTQNQPSFIFRDSIYFGIQGDLTVSPAFTDIDNDGDQDLLIGNFDGTISLYLNKGSASVPDFSFTQILNDNSGNPIDVGVYARPFPLDYDSDGDPDLAAGAFNGKFYFYKNTGTPENYQFTPDTTYIYRLNPADPNSSIMDVGDNSTPFFIDYDDDGDYDLFSGNRQGFIYYYRNAGTNVQPLWSLVTNNFMGQDFGANSFPCFNDIDNDTDEDFFVGNLKGGLYLYRNETVTGLTQKNTEQLKDFFSISAYPNPFNPAATISIETGKSDKFTINIFDFLGRKVKSIFSGELSKGKHQFNWNGENENEIKVAAGIYIVSAVNKNTLRTIKIILLK